MLFQIPLDSDYRTNLHRQYSDILDNSLYDQSLTNRISYHKYYTLFPRQLSQQQQSAKMRG